MRPPLPSDVLPLARAVSREVWKQPYREGEGCLHYGGGAAHRDHLLREADRLQTLVAAIRIVADFLPDGDDFYDVPARRKSACPECGSTTLQRVGGNDRPTPSPCVQCADCGWNDEVREEYCEAAVRRLAQGVLAA